MIGIIGAMEEEVRELIADMQECEMKEKASQPRRWGLDTAGNN